MKMVKMYRMKGILSIAHCTNKFVFQAVHMVFDGMYSSDYMDEEEKSSKLVFIGKNINKRALMEAFAACVYDEKTLRWSAPLEIPGRR